MPQKASDYIEDDTILVSLNDPLDVEAFSNLMAHAHSQGMSASDFIREEPQRTSRKAVRKRCLQDRKRSLWVQIASTCRNMWDGPARDPGDAFAQRLYGPAPPDLGKGKADQNGRT